jgi:hypothetical protein
MPVLEAIEQSLEEAVRREAAREEALSAAGPAAGAGAAWLDGLARLDGRLAALEECVARAAHGAAEADAALVEVADGLSRWLRAARGGGGTLAGGGGGAVS